MAAPSFSYLKKELGGHLEGAWRALGGHLVGKVKSLKALRTRRLRGQRHLTWRLFGKSIYGSICSRSPIIPIKVDHEQFPWASRKQVCRDLRHTCATLIARNKANIRHLQEMLGHASLDSTQVYTSVSITDQKEGRGDNKKDAFSFRCLLTRPSRSDKIG
jgi:integrase